MVDGPIEPISAEEGFGGVPKDTTDYFDPLDFARPSFEAAKERFMDAGKIDVDPEDPALFTAFKRSMDYLADTGMAGLELSDAAFKVAVGTIAELVPGQSQEQEKRLERDLYSMPEAFMGVSLGRIQQATDTVVEGVKEVGERLNRPSQAPRSMDTMGTFGGNVYRKKADYPSPLLSQDDVDQITKNMGYTPEDRYRQELDSIDRRYNSLGRELTEEEVEQYHDEVYEVFNRAEAEDINLDPYFTNPVQKKLDEIEIPKKGLLGSNLKKELENDPEIRGSFLSALNLDIDPAKRYTKEDIRKLRDDAAYKVITDSVEQIGPAPTGLDSTRFSAYQRQDEVGLQYDQRDSTGYTVGKPIDYVELTIQAGPEGNKLTFKAKSQHFDESTIAHARFTVVDPGVKDRKSIVVEELQSDLLQQGYEKPSPAKPSEVVEWEKFVEDKRDPITAPISEEGLGFTDEAFDELVKSVKGFKQGKYNFAVMTDKALPKELSDSVNKAYYALGGDDTSVSKEVFLNATDPWWLYNNNYLKSRPDEFTISQIRAYQDVASRLEGKPAVGAPPITDIKESIDATLKGIFQYANTNDINRIIIPPFEKIVEARFPRGSEGYNKALEPTSGFYQTYVTSLNKSIEELQQNFPELVTVREMALPYKEGTKLDFKSFTNILRGMTDKEKISLVRDVYPGHPMTRTDDDTLKFLGQDLQAFAMTEDHLVAYKDSLKKRGYLSGKEEVLPGTVIDIGGLKEVYDVSRPRFAQGGLAVEEQMNRLYQEGGLADDGTNIEPVTGNEVPTGSMDQEVRDNIPAQLSEGEYIFSADVVRYYGVKFFEDLRAQAKQDFARMEAEGRVGGEPVDTNGMPMEPDEELTPEEMQMLAEALGQAPTGMAMGGMVPQQQQAMYNPYEQQQTQYTPPTPVFQSTRTGMQEGGLAEEALEGYTGPTFDPSQYSYGGGFSSPFGEDTTTTSSGGMEIKEYVNPETGQTRMITVLNGEPIGLVPDGFIPASQEAKQQAQETKQEVETKTEGARVGMGGDGPPEGVGAPEGPSVDTGMESGAKSISNNISQGKIGKSIGMGLASLGPFGGLLGRGIKSITDKNTAMQNMIDAVTAQELGLEDAEEAMSMAMDFAQDIGLDDDQVSDMMGKARDTVSDTFSGGVEGSVGTTDPGKMGDVGATGDTRGRTGEALGRADEAPGPGPSRGRSDGEGPSGTAGAAGTGPGPSQGGAGGPSSGGRSGGPSGPAGASGTAGVGGPSGDSDAGTPRFEGGLMGKPEGSQNKKRKPNQRKKPIKNRKGLASK